MQGAIEGAVFATDSTFGKFVTYLINPVYQIVVVMAFLFFLYSVTLFLFQMNKPDIRELARRNLMYGLIGLFIILSVGAIIKGINAVVGGGLEY